MKISLQRKMKGKAIDMFLQTDARNTVDRTSEERGSFNGTVNCDPYN